MNASLEELGAVLRERTEAEPEHERALTRSLRIAAFCNDVLEAWGQQELHRGRRCCYGLTREHRAHAEAVMRRARHDADVARWMHDAGHRAAVAALATRGPGAMTAREIELAATRPEPPDDLTVGPPPSHWPDDPAAVGSVGAFFSALASSGQ